MFVTVNVSFNAYACHKVHFVAKFIWSRTFVPKSSRHEVTFHPFLSLPELDLLTYTVYDILLSSHTKLPAKNRNGPERSRKLRPKNAHADTLASGVYEPRHFQWPEKCHTKVLQEQ